MPRTKNPSIIDQEEDASPPYQSIPPQVDFDQDFQDALFASYWPKFQNRPIVTGRSMMLNDLEHKALLTDYVNGMGWGPLMYLANRVYPLKVRLFYNNLTVRHGRNGPILHSFIHGKVIRVDRAQLQRKLLMRT